MEKLLSVSFSKVGTLEQLVDACDPLLHALNHSSRIPRPARAPAIISIRGVIHIHIVVNVAGSTRRPGSWSGNSSRSTSIHTSRALIWCRRSHHLWGKGDLLRDLRNLHLNLHRRRMGWLSGLLGQELAELSELFVIELPSISSENELVELLRVRVSGWLALLLHRFDDGWISYAG